MIKHEQFRDTDQLKAVVPGTSTVFASLRSHMFPTTTYTIPQQTIDPHAIDISSIKGRFAWEKIGLGDTYMPVIFRGTIKYFCVKMLHKLLPEYPEDFIHRSSSYQYRKPIDLYAPTSNELKLLNRINAHHSHWAYTRQPFNAADELVRASDFLLLYEHLRGACKPGQIPRAGSLGSLRQILPQPQHPIEQSSNFLTNGSNAARKHPHVPVTSTPIQIPSCSTSELFRQNDTSSIPRSVIAPAPGPVPAPSLAPVPTASHSLRPPSKYQAKLAMLSQQTSHYLPEQLPQQLPPQTPMQQLIATASNSITSSINTVLPSKPSPVQVSISASQSPTLMPKIAAVLSSPPDSVVSSSTKTTSGKRSATVPQIQLAPMLKQSSSASLSSVTATTSPSTTKVTNINSGWLQINKLYTPYVSLNTSNHHLYKIPVSLLTFYDLLKFPTSENNATESKDTAFSLEQTLVTPQEIELINELCIKQNIKPFSIDTKLIDLLTFYKYCSANILFVKELPLEEPKAAICKDWSSIVQINGGICRLRNITTLHEQTVPFIGNKLLKNFIISLQCSASASLSTPTTMEMEFLQLILFFSNMSINIRNAKLIDIESVQKEYNVDLILLFNDKFPLNVLNYQHQDNRPSTSQEQIASSNSSAATNTFAESTPPPSPPSPPINNNTVNSTSQLPLTSSSPSSSTISATFSTTSNSSNRFLKTITFHGHPMTAYICSGLGSNAQRECISVKALCNMMYPNSSIVDKLESKMLRLLRVKNINRFRPQNQQAMGFTRLIDIQDIEKHWDYIEQGMRSLVHNDREAIVLQDISLSILDKDLKASTLDKVKDNSNIVEQVTSVEVNKSEKRSLEKQLGPEDVSLSKSVDKRIRISRDDINEQSKMEQSQAVKTISNNCNHLDDNHKNGNKSDDDGDDDGDDDNDKKNQRISRPPVRIVRPHSEKNNITNKLQQQVNRRTSLSSQKATLPMKKKIKIRKRLTPRIRSTKQTLATWVQKYNIEECCICLDFYDPIYDTGKY
ncbi:unnamed protein product [Adineta steineri]|uniref:Uncharacterized protein n=1 Tax=Adineta steineri TaxID=433720 RepID=A0A819EW98_9BILA|nr:unnamed protein product [Adineta steineri]